MQQTANDLITVWGDVPAGTNGCKNVFNTGKQHGLPAVGDARLPSVPMSTSALAGLATNVKVRVAFACSRETREEEGLKF